MSARAPVAWSPRGWRSERPTGQGIEAWCYTDRFSYAAGDRIEIHIHSTVPEVDLRIVRDGADPRVVWTREAVAAGPAPTPDDAYAQGCGWPVSLTLDIPEEWRSGFYLVIVGAGSGSQRWEREHFFVLRSDRDGRSARAALVLTTSTVLAYNDWGGANHYRGLGDDPRRDIGSPLSAVQRPIARGMLRKPAGAPREGNRFTPAPGFEPRYPAFEWARLHGYSRHHASAGWATYERPFVRWAEARGYELDFVTQHDLDRDPEALDGYRCALIVGHDEYWSWAMRDTLDRFVERGGNLARFAGNFQWQVRLEDGGRTQVCWRLPALDPMASEAPHLATTIWDAVSVGRPGTGTMGLTGSAGIYNRFGATTPRSSGGFTVYRPENWSLAGTDLYYGDILGGVPIGVAAFELDGVDYTFEGGLPFPTHADGAPDSLEIVGLCPAAIGEIDRWEGRVPLGATVEDFTDVIGDLGSDAPGWLRDRAAGAGVIATWERNGRAFNAGTTEWVVGLEAGDPFIERITANVLDELAGGPAARGRDA